MGDRMRVLVIGGGIAGLSCAAHASREGAEVTVLEAEAQPGYHSSGRSAAVYIEPYIGRIVYALSRASLDFFADPPAPYWREPVVSPLGSLMIAPAEVADQVDTYLDQWAALCPQLEEIDPEEALEQVPVLSRRAVARAVVDPRAMAMDVHGLLDGFRRMLLGAGGALRGNARVTALERNGSEWRVALEEGSTLTADVVVNAAGAWGDGIAALAGAGRLGLQPLRRTALLIDAEGYSVASWPLLYTVDGTFYLKPESGQLLLSPSDETPSPPCDAQPDDLDVAVAVDRLQQHSTLKVPRVERKWAGLRSFLPDRRPAVGYDAAVPGFFWLVGQGGFGMQTSWALGRTSAALLAGRPLPDDVLELGVDATLLSPQRFQT